MLDEDERLEESEREEIESSVRSPDALAAAPQFKGSVESMYLNDIKKQPLLTNEETIQLIRELRAIKGDASREKEYLSKKHKIINANMRLVATIAIRKFVNRGVELGDLLSEGSFAIASAIENYDLTREAQFSTCLYYWIKQQLQLAVIKYGTDIRVPTWVDVKIKQMYMHRLQIAAEENIDEDSVKPAAIAAAMETTEAEVLSLMEIYHKKIAKKLDSSTNVNRTNDSSSDDDTYELQDNTPSKFELRVLSDKQKNLIKVIEMLGNKKQIEVLKMKYGFTTGQEMNNAEIGRYYESLGQKGCTRERIRQIEEEALEKLRTPYFMKKMQELGVID